VHLAARGLLQRCAGAVKRVAGAAQGRAGAAQSQADADLDGRHTVCGKQQAAACADHGRGASGMRSGRNALHGVVGTCASRRASELPALADAYAPRSSPRTQT